MNLPRKRSPSEILRRGYSDEEVFHIYELARFCLENGDSRRAETILAGLTEIMPDFSPAWLATAYVLIQRHDYDAALNAVQHALRVDPASKEALFYLVSCFLTTGDYTSAGTYLGEINELIENKVIEDPAMIRFYRGQLARYQSRE